MVPVRLVLAMVQRILCSISPVLAGSMMIQSKIIHSMVNSLSSSYFCVGEIEFDFLAWINDRSKRTMIAFSPDSTFQVRLPVGNDQTSLLHLIVYIRDAMECVTEVNITSVNVRPDSAQMNDLITNIQSPSPSTTSNPITQLLSSGNPNTVGQVISSISQQFNKNNTENMNSAISSKSEKKLR